jgi:hypothetical protein
MSVYKKAGFSRFCQWLLHSVPCKQHPSTPNKACGYLPETKGYTAALIFLRESKEMRQDIGIAAGFATGCWDEEARRMHALKSGNYLDTYINSPCYMHMQCDCD